MDLIKISADSLRGLQVSERRDEFSVQYSIDDDPMFWMRIESPETRPVQITDLLPGKLHEMDAARILAYALHRAVEGVVDEVLFRDVVRLDEDNAGGRLVWIDRVLEAYVSLERRFIVGKRLIPRGEKTDLAVEFKTFGNRRL